MAASRVRRALGRVDHSAPGAPTPARTGTLPVKWLFWSGSCACGNVAAATIEVERIQGPVMLISGTDDQLWPSGWFGTIPGRAPELRGGRSLPVLPYGLGLDGPDDEDVAAATFTMDSGGSPPQMPPRSGLQAGDLPVPRSGHGARLRTGHVALAGSSIPRPPDLQPFSSLGGEPSPPPPAGTAVRPSAGRATGWRSR
jgi:hypothetical protein